MPENTNNTTIIEGLFDLKPQDPRQLLNDILSGPQRDDPPTFEKNLHEWLTEGYSGSYYIDIEDVKGIGGDIPVFVPDEPRMNEYLIELGTKLHSLKQKSDKNIIYVENLNLDSENGSFESSGYFIPLSQILDIKEYEDLSESYLTGDPIYGFVVCVNSPYWKGGIVYLDTRNENDEVEDDDDLETNPQNYEGKTMTVATSFYTNNTTRSPNDEWFLADSFLSDHPSLQKTLEESSIQKAEIVDEKGEIQSGYFATGKDINPLLEEGFEIFGSYSKTYGAYPAKEFKKKEAPASTVTTTVTNAATPAPSTTAAAATEKPPIAGAVISSAFLTRNSLWNDYKTIIGFDKFHQNYTNGVKGTDGISKIYGYTINKSDFPAINAALARCKSISKNSIEEYGINSDGYYIIEDNSGSASNPYSASSYGSGRTTGSSSTYGGGYSPSTYSAPVASLINTKPMPTVTFTAEVLARMGYYVGLCNEEIGWLGTMKIERSEDGDKILIDEVFLLTQGVHATTTELDPSSISEMAFAIMEADNYSDERVNRLLVWGHSHVNMGTSPSGQDDSQMRIFKENDAPHMIRLIANKHGDIRVDFFDYENNIKWEKLPWSCAPDPETSAKAEEQLALLDLSE